MKKSIIRILMLGILFSGMNALADNVPEAPEIPETPEAPSVEHRSSGKAFVGVVTERVRSSTAVQLGIPPGVGLTVESVVKGSSAAEYGIEKYDILLKLDDQLLTNVSHFTTLLSMKSPGDTVMFTIFRKGNRFEQEMVLGAKNKEKNISWTFETKMEALGEKLEALAERHEIKKYLADPGKIEETIRSALEQAQYHIESFEGDDHHISFINTGGARTIVSVDEGTLIMEPGENEGQTKVIAIDAEGEVIYRGMVGEDGEELGEVASWVKERFHKMNKNKIRVIVSEDINVTVEEDLGEDD